MTSAIPLHTRAICDACREAPATVEIDSGFFLCGSCAGTVEQFVLDSVAPIVSPVGVNAVVTVDLAPGPSAATATNPVSESGEIPESNPGPSLATGMSRDPANAGGEHEAVTAISNEHDRFCIELETGTSPGACGTERERVGAPNPVAKATKGNAGTAGTTGPVRRSTAGTGLRVGEADADRPATSENGRDGGERPSLIKAQRTDVLGRAITPHGAPDEFLQAVILSSDTNECIRWPYAVDGGGYGQIRRNGRKELVHRIVCEKVHGPSPSSEHLATHTCGRGHEGCCSPLHLVWGTVVENAADRIKHGTHCRGERQWAAKLTAGDVIEIKRLAAGGMSQSAIANLFSVGQQQISAIILKKKWAWLDVTSRERPATNPNSGRNARSCSGIKCGDIEPLGGASNTRDRTSGFLDATAGETATNPHCEPELLEITGVRMREISTQQECRPTPLAPFDRFSSSCGSDDPGRASVVSDAGMSGPQDSNSNPVTASLVPVDSAPCSPPEAAPLFSSCNTPEASGTAREAPCTGCGTAAETSRVGSQTAPRSLLDFEAEVSALESVWASGGIVPAGSFGLIGEKCRDAAELGIPSFIRRGHPDCIIKNSTTFRVTQDSRSQEPASSSDISNSSFSVGA